MNSARPCLFLLFLPAVVYGHETLDDECGETVWVYSYSSDSYTISDPSQFHSGCQVTFWRASNTGEIQLEVSGYNLKASDCHVQVFDNSYVSKTDGDITGFLTFSRTIRSTDGSGYLSLHVTGDRCDKASLFFTVSKLDCPEYTCDNSQCVDWSDVCDGWNDCSDDSDEENCVVFWTTGAYVGVSLGIICFLIIVTGIAGFFLRRRVRLVSAPGIIGCKQTSVTQSRW